MSSPTALPISPAQAAHITKVSRRTIMRAIEAKELQAFRDNRNRWKITPSDLEKWATAQLTPTGQTHPKMPTLPTSETFVELHEKLATATARADAAERARDQAEADRDHWRDMAQKLADQPRRWWPWHRRGRT